MSWKLFKNSKNPRKIFKLILLSSPPQKTSQDIQTKAFPSNKASPFSTNKVLPSAGDSYEHSYEVYSYEDDHKKKKKKHKHHKKKLFGKKRKKRKKKKFHKKHKMMTKFMLPMLIAYKLKFFTLIPIFVGKALFILGNMVFRNFFHAVLYVLIHSSVIKLRFLLALRRAMML